MHSLLKSAEGSCVGLSSELLTCDEVKVLKVKLVLGMRYDDMHMWRPLCGARAYGCRTALRVQRGSLRA